ncbi:PepSY-associated TM helix domain-containing protein [Gallaecimonas mangrovi]|uniref:PepSY-associated TM helix domain-containing protein n=1 Tax=Gallaecimonas mangrovi TaxID=2291597 RepID=UPI000E1FC59D|nr:PepSY-associated TM helix domain-containing protein [Gallaecimonas mangrovi]
MRRTLWKWHGYLGLTAAIPLLVIALTGSVLVFKKELDSVLMPSAIEAQTTQRLAMGQLKTAAQAQLGEHEILGWQPGEPGYTDLLYVAKLGTYQWQKAYLDPSSGALVRSPAALQDDITDWLLELHFTFLSGPIGIAVAGVTAVLLLAQAISGFILHRRFWKTFFTLRLKKSLRLLLSDAHKMLGIIAAPVFLVLGITGAWWNLDEFSEAINKEDDSIYALKGRYYSDQINLDTLISSAQQQIPGFQTTYIRFPDKSYPGIHLFGHPQNAGALRSGAGSIVSFDDQTGAVTGQFPAAKANWLYQLKDSFEPLHFGTFGGLISRVIWCIVGFIPCLLALSGFVMWRKRLSR